MGAYAAALAAGTFFFFRWINPILPPLCVLIGWLAARVAQRLPRPGLVCAAIVAGLGALPAARSIAIDRLFLRETTFEQAARVLAERVPAGAPIACPDAGVARILGSSVAVTPWLSIEERPEWWVVVPRHPLPGIGQDPGWVSAVLAGAGDAEQVAELRAFRAVFVERGRVRDRRLLLLSAARLRRARARGPRHRDPEGAVAPESPAAAGAPPPAVSVAVRSGLVHIELRSPPGVDVLGYYVKFAPEAEAAVGKVARTVRVRPRAARSPVHERHPRALGRAGRDRREGRGGPWSEPRLVTVE